MTNAPAANPVPNFADRPVVRYSVLALGALACKGYYVEPTCAAAGAGLTQLIADGLVRPDETTVLVLTGSGLKSSERIGQLLGLAAREA